MYSRIVSLSSKKQAASAYPSVTLNNFLCSEAESHSETMLVYAITAAPVIVDYREGRAAKIIFAEIDKSEYKVFVYFLFAVTGHDLNYFYLQLQLKTWKKLIDIFAVNQCWGIVQKVITWAYKQHDAEFSPRIEVFRDYFVFK